MQPKLRPAQTGDIERLVQFSRQLNEEDPSFTGEFHFDEAAVHAALEELLAAPALGRVWLIEVDKRPAGYVVLTFGFSLESRGRDALVDELYLIPDYRGRGIGRWVMGQMEVEARAGGLSRIYLEVELPNVRAQAFYQDLGYEDHNRYLMSKWLLE
jgi:GNAT superfamily N-acetyltransferase